MRQAPRKFTQGFRRLKLALGLLSILLAVLDTAAANDGGEPIHVTLDASSVRFPDKNSVDVLLATSTDFFDRKTSKALHASDGYRLRLKFDDRWQLVQQQIDPAWSGVRGFFCDPKFDPYDGVETYVHVRDDGSMARFSRTGDEAFSRQAFDEEARKWGPPVAVKVPRRSGSFNLTTEGGRWLCVEQGKPPTSVMIYDLEQDKVVEDEWLESTILKNFQFTDIWNGTRISNEKTFVMFKHGHRDRTEFLLFGFGMPGVTKLVAPAKVRDRALHESRGGRAAIVFNAEPDVIYAHEIDRRSAGRIVDFKDVKRAESKSLYNAMHNVRYHGENRTVVGIDADRRPVQVGPAAFEAKARVVRWKLETGKISETIVPFAEQFQLVDRHVVPKGP